MGVLLERTQDAMLAPNGVVTQIYPLAGNEAAIGHDLLNDPRRRTEARAAIESRKLTLAGPFRLIQGGIAEGRMDTLVLARLENWSGSPREYDGCTARLFIHQTARGSPPRGRLTYP